MSEVGQYGVEGVARRTSIKEEKWRVTSSLVSRGVEGIGNERQDTVPILVCRIDVHGQHVGKRSVCALDQTISLWMVGRRMAEAT